MSSLHILSTSTGSALADCLRVATEGDTLLLTQDGVYAAFASDDPAFVSPLAFALGAGIVVYALVPDVDARGLSGRLQPAVRLVDDNGFVALTERHPRCVSWY